MKILIITNYLGEKSGWGSYSLFLVGQLMKNGFEVVVVCNKKSEEHYNIKQIEILPNPLSFKKNYLLAPLYALKIALKIRGAEKPDLAHCFVEPYAFISYLLSKICGIKYFLTIHGSYGVKTMRNAFYRILQIIAYKNARKVICVSNYTKRRVLEYKSLTNFTVIPNGVDVDFFGITGRADNKENMIFSVGALKKRKGFDVMIKAMEIVVKRVPDAKYCMAGTLTEDDKYVSHIEKLIEGLGLDGSVVLLGKVSDEEKKELYKKAKIFALTPISDKFNFEGFGLVYLEANARGLPVVGSYGNGGEGAIKEGYNGFLAKAGDPADTAEKIIKLLTDKELYEKMSRNAIKWCREMSWGNIIKKYLEIFND